ncbi:TetR/AcrR family transcriptional regulator [Rhodococcus sp. IEGM 1351]|uniref:TetR/AcrR family transcriptional regulator n=1 Tax=Rhodococcus sp. IEGM 1351 TaxID=3047089 RepID=UPI0024B636D1|nr:TetR/AcrR family transcriptional regulator [Rhodococcus sp. IEGM 1351]MDI9934664.1 TetR/AcrR family transcriptional regulator [Rhodococcus sp. IEGM 1351]
MDESHKERQRQARQQTAKTKRLRTQQAILDALGSFESSEGSLTVAAIAKKAGVGSATFYNHFNDLSSAIHAFRSRALFECDFETPHDRESLIESIKSEIIRVSVRYSRLQSYFYNFGLINEVTLEDVPSRFMRILFTEEQRIELDEADFLFVYYHIFGVVETIQASHELHDWNEMASGYVDDDDYVKYEHNLSDRIRGLIDYATDSIVQRCIDKTSFAPS